MPVNIIISGLIIDNESLICPSTALNHILYIIDSESLILMLLYNIIITTLV